jgi:hypothetical protein
MTRPQAQTDGVRLDESHAAFEARGYAGQFMPAKDGRVACMACGALSPAADVPVESQGRLEGVSDPDDESMVFGIACPSCGLRGTLTLAYGPRASRDEAAVMSALPPPRRAARATPAA